MADISEMNKGELQAHAKAEYGVDLDMRKSLENLLEEVKKLEKPAVAIEKPKDSPPKATHLLNKATGLFFPHAKMLADRGDLIPCDDKGRPA